MIVNGYDNYQRTDQMLGKVESNMRRRTLVDTDWDSIIEGRVVLLGDLNVYS